MNRMNAQFTHWFDEGAIAEAILGQGDFFVPSADDPDEHDRILALGQLLRWATDPDRARKAGKGVEAAISTSLAAKNARAAFDIAWCYLLVAESQSASLPIDWPRVRRSLQAAFDSGMDIETEVASSVLERTARRGA
jgi:hypothetical protein